MPPDGDEYACRGGHRAVAVSAAATATRVLTHHAAAAATATAAAAAAAAASTAMEIVPAARALSSRSGYHRSHFGRPAETAGSHRR